MPGSSRIALCLLSLAAVSTAIACQQQQEPPTDSNLQEPANLPSVAAPQPPIDRSSLLAAAAQAASAAAAGADLPKSVNALDGRQFEIRIRFGCRGPATQLRSRWLGWSFDEERRRIRVRAMPTISIDDPLVSAIAGEEVEAVEGFWIPRPWLLTSVCPETAALRTPPPAAQAGVEDGDRQQEDVRPSRQPEDEAVRDEGGEPLPSAARIGIAQFFTEQDPRTRRRDDRPYEASYTPKQGAAISSQGYNLVLSGRLRALPGRGVIECNVRSPDNPPDCVASAEFHRVWIEQPSTGEVLAEWGGG